jgi:hypothetical protein
MHQLRGRIDEDRLPVNAERCEHAAVRHQPGDGATRRMPAQMEPAAGYSLSFSSICTANERGVAANPPPSGQIRLTRSALLRRRAGDNRLRNFAKQGKADERNSV